MSAQNFWEQINGPYGSASGATVNDFLQYNDSTIFLATNEGLIKSSDNGETWNRILNVTKIVSCLSKDALGTLYCGAKDAANNYYLLRSTDSGSNWFAINNNFWADIRCIMITFKDTIMLGTWDKGVYRTFDYGASWNRVNNGNIYNAIHDIIQLSDGSVLAGSDGGGVFKTTNWGDLWIESNTGLPANSLGYRYAESFIEFAPGQVLTGTHNNIYYSSDYGEIWYFRSNGFNNNIATCFEIDELGTIYTGNYFGGVYYSTDSGNFWNDLGLGISARTLGWDTASRLYAGSSSSGLYRYTSADSTWISVYNQVYTYFQLEIDNILLTKSDNLIAYSEGWGNFYLTNSGEDWTKIITPYGMRVYGTINDSILIGGSSTHTYVSNDTGRTWNITGNIRICSLFFEPTSKIIYLGSWRANGYPCGIFTSNDYGQSWNLLYQFPPLNLAQAITKLHISRTNQVILANEYNGGLAGVGNRLFQSTDHGQTWQVIYFYYFTVTSIMEDIYNNLYAIAAIDLLVSEDEGMTWITKSAPSSSVLASDYAGRIYLDLRYSTDKGSTWLNLPNSGFQGAFNDDLKINHSNRIYAASTQGVFYGEADSIVVSVEKNDPLKTFYLSQNHPNPFNPSTTIRYEIPERSFTTIKIYDVLGKEVATIVNEEKAVGTHTVEFDGTDLSSGIYFYQLKAGNFVETKKMILLK